MDPISLILTALVTGAAAGIEPAAKQIVKDAYDGLKTIIKTKYRQVSVDMLENDPADKTRQDIIKKDLEKSQVSSDEELLRQAQIVLDAVQKHAPEAVGAVGINLEEVRVGASLDIKNIIAAGSVNLKAKNVDVKQNFTIEGIQAGKGKDTLDPRRP